MKALEEEPAANIVEIGSPLENQGLPLLESPNIGEPTEARLQRENIVDRGRNRFKNRLSSLFSKVSDLVDNLHRRRGSRGDCPGCQGTGEHHWGSRCKMRKEPRRTINFLPTINFFRTPILNPSVFR